MSESLEYESKRASKTARQRAGRNAGRGGGQRPVNREIMISKKLSWLLRHGAKSVGIRIDSGGWANINDVLRWTELRKLEATFEELKVVVANNEKKRYQIIPRGALDIGELSTTKEAAITELLTLELDHADDPTWHLIRATQGHSLKDVQASNLLTPINAGDIPSLCPELVVHGTDPSAWALIEKSGGLKKMGRQHIHFAARPAGSGEAVVSGMRSDSQILIWIDVRRSQEEIKWWISANGVILTEGMEGFLPMRYFDRVEQRDKGQAEVRVIWKPAQQAYVEATSI